MGVARARGDRRIGEKVGEGREGEGLLVERRFGGEILVKVGFCLGRRMRIGEIKRGGEIKRERGGEIGQ